MITLILTNGLCGFAQVTIEECQRRAQEHYPLVRQYVQIEEAEASRLANAGKGYLPQVKISGNASYRSEVTRLPFDASQWGIPGLDIPALSKDQYVLSLDALQVLWDGGEIKSGKESVRTAAQVEKRRVAVGLYALYQQVNTAFFGVLLADAGLHQNKLLQEELARNYQRVQACVQHGISEETDLHVVRVEQLKAEQHATKLAGVRASCIAILANLTGMEADETTDFVRPVLLPTVATSVSRPELSLYDAQIKNYEAENALVTAGLFPKFALFATGGYGKPGLNMLENRFAPYYIVGMKFEWNIGRFYTLKNRRKLIRNHIGQTEIQRELFLFNTRLDMIRKNKEIKQCAEQLKYDDEIIRLKTAIRKASEAKMTNGVLSVTELMRDLHAEQMAIQDKIHHEIAYMQALYDLKFTAGHTNE